ncbi:N-acetyltransferase [Paenibacillus albiflavus]|uniref:N-acetyltransferase n=1 Tax=Paenibacillus albiflavus TaxID=2545760 RepID=A0A4R4EJP6_9BACL|nr:N-acetyltransferase [Paenibacillus albiflavus]
MQQYRFQPMTEEFAAIICKWRYPGEYSFYDMEETDEDIAELLEGDYYAALDFKGDLIGFICSGNAARLPIGHQIGIYNDPSKIDIGLGMKPDITGKGSGQQFLTQAIHFLKELYPAHSFQLVVATFNERAIKVYERVGFVKGIRFINKRNEQEIEFLVMNLMD